MPCDAHVSNFNVVRWECTYKLVLVEWSHRALEFINTPLLTYDESLWMANFWFIFIFERTKEREHEITEAKQFLQYNRHYNIKVLFSQ